MKSGHFYFGKNRTFLNWLDTDSVFLDLKHASCIMINIAGCDHESEGVYGVGSDHTSRHSLAVQLTHVAVVMENIIPIRIRPVVQQAVFVYGKNR